MIKFKHLFYTVVIATVLYSCGSDNNNSFVDNHDHEGQAVIDNDSLIKFFKNNYYNATLDSVKVIDNNQTSLFDDVNLVTKEVTENEIDYKLYYYITKVGTPTVDKGFPTVMDSVYAKYRGQTIVRNDSLSADFDKNTTWFSLNNVIRGWTYSLVHFKGGNNVTGNGPITYENGSEGIIFIPSGLAYRNGGTGNIPPNSNLMFTVELWDFVKDTDADLDNVPSIYEDIDGDGDPRNDDTNENGIANYNDVDDDGDGILTKDEDKNGDGDPRNDFNDPNKPNVPDYLNRDI
ncbi:FKBP-type peptidyl-prolyl cis-trans isomerase [Tenacibaculum insulae]|uniref:FKBP-type peptidyl-prolyl cis-trans isomerase n=1 Tax=Tenacibaculum insulae TaxID=2029677 RepID=UPI003AB14D18